MTMGTVVVVFTAGNYNQPDHWRTPIVCSWYSVIVGRTGGSSVT